MLEPLAIILMGLFPALFSILLMRRAERSARERLQSALEQAASSWHSPPVTLSAHAEHHFSEGIGYCLGDVTCRFNARSAYLRCAVNPYGPCQVCRHYEPLTPNHLESPSHQ